MAKPNVIYADTWSWYRDKKSGNGITAYIRADLVEKLIERVSHRKDCHLFRHDWRDGSFTGCTCGLDDLIREVRG